MDVDVKIFDDLDAVADDSDGALDRAAQTCLHDRIDWLRLTGRHFPALRPMICRARSGEDRAWLSLASAGRRATPFGSWYTLAFAPVFSPGCRHGVKPMLVFAIARALRGKVAAISLYPIREDAADLLAAAFAGVGWRARRGETSANWVTDVHGLAPADYLAARPSRLRRTLARRARRAALAIRIADRFDAGDWNAFEAVFARSWKPDEGSMPFLRDLAAQEGAAGTLRLGIGLIDARPVAAQLWLVENGVVTIHKLAHDRRDDAVSPGTQLTAAMVSRVLDRDRPRLIDFGAGDDPYKSDWMDLRRPLFTLELIDPRTPLGLARGLRWKAAALVGRDATD